MGESEVNDKHNAAAAFVTDGLAEESCQMKNAVVDSRQQGKRKAQSFIELWLGVKS